MNNLLKEYVKEIILIESADAIFGRKSGLAKSIYNQIIEFDNFFNQYCNGQSYDQKIYEKLIDILSKIPKDMYDFHEDEYEEDNEVICNEYSYLNTLMYIEYIESIPGIKYISKGKSRKVYDIGNDFVLKLSIGNEELNNQNNNESWVKMLQLMKPFVPLVFAKSSVNTLTGDVFWIISEKCTPINHDKNSQIQWLRKIGVNENKINKIIEKTDSMIMETYISVWIYFLLQDIKTKQYNYDDYSKIELKLLEAQMDNYFGIIDIRVDNVGYGSDGRPVFLDTGYINDIT
jgi:hypothetical protein